MRVVVQIQEDGIMTFAADEPVELIVVSECAPHDRVYRMTPNGPAFEIGGAAVDAILGEDAIGHAGDERHAALTHCIESWLAGEPHLKPVK
ncbi:MAG: hypothetical protein ACK4TP_01475 [Hyphomicrobium sp.]